MWYIPCCNRGHEKETIQPARTEHHTRGDGAEVMGKGMGIGQEETFVLIGRNAQERNLAENRIFVPHSDGFDDFSERGPSLNKE